MAPTTTTKIAASKSAPKTAASPEKTRKKAFVSKPRATAYGIFVKRETKLLRDQHPEMTAEERKEIISSGWKAHKAQSSSDEKGNSSE